MSGEAAIPSPGEKVPPQGAEEECGQETSEKHQGNRLEIRYGLWTETKH